MYFLFNKQYKRNKIMKITKGELIKRFILIYGENWQKVTEDILGSKGIVIEGNLDTLYKSTQKKPKIFMFKNSIYTNFDEVVKWFKAHPKIAKRFSGVDVDFYIEAVCDWNDKQSNATLRGNIGWVKTIKQFMTTDSLDNKLRMIKRGGNNTDYKQGNY